ncbi:septum formation protein Maf [Exophiala mesophila]|uniref:Septum formation protein Maf n=1 Tax=Exophiala mesophila TaxID=212818 RepID=A0A0D1ZPV8_EXOME|nr:septum formation protein Maf [Exophiala mesophila]KIV96642.1 septum formation protein Maf [Exophiala mesophila]
MASSDKAGLPPPDTPTDAPPSYEATSDPSPNKNRNSNTNTGPPGTSSQPRRPNLPPPPPLQLPALNLLRGKRVVLASASPRRQQLLAQIGLTDLEIIPSKFEENLPKTLSPFDYVLGTASQKALAVYKSEVDDESKSEPALIIAADTIVVTIHGEILEKPRSEAHHIAMLKSLRDTGVHKVYTAVTVVRPLDSARDPGYAIETATEETTVKFDRDLSDDVLLAYVRTREGADKAGGYGIQGTGAILVEGIEGSFDNVVGLPLRVTLKLIESVVAKSDDDEILPDDDYLDVGSDLE